MFLQLNKTSWQHLSPNVSSSHQYPEWRLCLSLLMKILHLMDWLGKMSNQSSLLENIFTSHQSRKVYYVNQQLGWHRQKQTLSRSSEQHHRIDLESILSFWPILISFLLARILSLLLWIVCKTLKLTFGFWSLEGGCLESSLARFFEEGLLFDSSFEINPRPLQLSLYY